MNGWQNSPRHSLVAAMINRTDNSTIEFLEISTTHSFTINISFYEHTVAVFLISERPFDIDVGEKINAKIQNMKQKKGTYCMYYSRDKKIISTLFLKNHCTFE